MLGKIIATLIAASALGLGGWAAIKYGIPFFGNKASEKMKIQIDDDGKCIVSDNLKSLIESQKSHTENPESETEEENDQCLKILKSNIDGSAVEIDWGKRQAQYEELKTKIQSELQKLVGVNSQNSVTQ